MFTFGGKEKKDAWPFFFAVGSVTEFTSSVIFVLLVLEMVLCCILVVESLLNFVSLWVKIYKLKR